MNISLLCLDGYSLNRFLLFFRRTARLAVRSHEWKQFFPGLGVLVILTLVFGVCSQNVHAADKYRAFYFNASGDLLQVEQVPDGDLAIRSLQNADEVKHPLMKFNKTERIFGANKPMSRFATIAVYYTYDGSEPMPNTEDVRTRPVKVENLEFVQERNIVNCLQRWGSDPCYFPKRCHCQTACCCY